MFSLCRLPHYRRFLYWNILLVSVAAAPLPHFVGIDSVTKPSVETFNAAFALFSFMLSAIAIFLSYPLLYSWAIRSIASGKIQMHKFLLRGLLVGFLVCFIVGSFFALGLVLVGHVDSPIVQKPGMVSDPAAIRAIMLILSAVLSPIMGLIAVVMMLKYIVPLGLLFGFANFQSFKNTPKTNIDAALNLIETRKP